jgi:hypothetical protein
MSMLSQSLLSQDEAHMIHDVLRGDRTDVPFQLHRTCASSTAIHDLAALGEGNLSATGRRRLAAHLAQCRMCKRVLATWIRERDAAQDADDPVGHATVTDPASERRFQPLACHVYLDDGRPVVEDAERVVLFLAADPGRTSPAALGRGCLEIRRRLQAAGAIRFEARWAVTLDDVLRHVVELRPTILHFAGHSGQRGVTLLDEHGAPRPVSAGELTALVAVSPRARVAVFNRCHSTAHARALRGQLSCVIGTPGEIGDDDAHCFAAAFYTGLADRRSMGRAVEHGVAAINARRTSESLLPIYWTRDATGAVVRGRA